MASFFYNKIEWLLSKNLVPYEEALDFMEKRVNHIFLGNEAPCIWFLEHPALITLGTSGSDSDILEPSLPLYRTGRGGKATFHGPGQRIVYVMLDLRTYGCDLRKFIHSLERWILLTLMSFSIKGFTDPKRIGVWVPTPRGEEKIASIGIRVRKWISFHGLAFNVNPDLHQFKTIVPCGLRTYNPCSLASLGYPITINQVDKAMVRTFAQAFPA